MPLKVVIADDSILFRRVLGEVLDSLPDVEVVASAPNGLLALKKVQEFKPDLLTLDMEMPELDGLGVLGALRERGDKVAVIVVSALTRRGGDLTVQALEKGAFDFITKPEGMTAEKSREQLRQELAPRIKTLAGRLAIRSILQGAGPASRRPVADPVTLPPLRGTDAAPRRPQPVAANQKIDLVVIGVSTGGPTALAQLLPALPVGLGVPVLIVQHMPAMFTRSLADSLAGRCALRVSEAVDGDRIAPDCVYIAPGGRQMKLVQGEQGAPVLRMTDDPPENHCRPAVDYLFRSVAQNFSGSVLAIILTGMGQDGTTGLRLLKRRDCFAIAQDEASCVVYGMPKSAVESGTIDLLLPLDQIAAQIRRLCNA